MFAPELLPRITDYSHIHITPEGMAEVGDRFREALRLKDIARDCFTAAGSPPSGERQEIWENPDPVIKRGDTLLVHVRTMADLRFFRESGKDAFSCRWIRVRLGCGLEEAGLQEALLTEYLLWQSLDERVVLETCRGSVTHSIRETAGLSGHILRCG